MRGPNAARRGAERPGRPIALALVTISRLSLTLSPGGGSHALRCNRHALIMQMSLGRAGPLLMSDWHVHSGYIERRNASRLSVHLTHDRALRIDDRASFSTLQPLSLPSPFALHPVGHIGRVSLRPRASPSHFSCRLHIAPRAQYRYILTEGADRDPSGPFE